MWSSAFQPFHTSLAFFSTFRPLLSSPPGRTSQGVLQSALDHEISFSTSTRLYRSPLIVAEMDLKVAGGDL